MQGDGNFVVYGPSGAIWASYTDVAGSTITMQADGNLVIYSPSGAAVWSSSTAPSSDDALVIQTDSNLVIYTGSSALRSSNGGSASGSAGQPILSAAAAEAGISYCFDGGSPSGPTHGDGNADGATQYGGSTAGFDCTGLTLFAVYQATNIVLPHGLGQENCGTLISDPSVSQLQPGDVLLFGSSVSNYQHTGIYAGNGVMWDANIALSPYSDGVQERAVSWETAAYPLVGAVRF